jgi:hypothetical protein
VIHLDRLPLQPDGRIQRQQRGAVVVVLLSLVVVSVLASLVVNYIVLKLSNLFQFRLL